MLSILLPLFLLTSTLAAPASPIIPGHLHRLGRRSQSFVPHIPHRPAHAHAGRLSGSRVDAREHSPEAAAHDIIPDAVEGWGSASGDDLDPELTLQAEVEGWRSAQWRDDVIQRAWVGLVGGPEAEHIEEGEGEKEGLRRSWFDGEYVGDLDEDEADEGAEEERSGEGAEETARGWIPSWWRNPIATLSGTDALEPTPADSARAAAQFRVAAKASPPVGGWGVNPSGQWYLVHLE